MKQRASPALLASFLALLCLFLNNYMMIVLLAFFPNGVMGANFVVFSFLGSALGAFLCPLFLPLHRKTPEAKVPFAGIVFILALILPIVVIRTFGVELWFASLMTRSVVAFLTGILHPMCYGLFFLACLRSPPGSSPLGPSENRTGYGVLLFALAMALGISARFCALHLLDAAEPLRTATFLHNTITVLIAGLGASSLVCVIVFSRAAALNASSRGPDTSRRTDWYGILGLIGIAIVYKFLDGIMEWRLNHIIVSAELVNQPYALVVVAALILCGFLAGRSIRIFVRGFLPPAIILFIFLPCMVLFDVEKHAGFFQFMNILFSIFSHVVWVFFTAALIELYAGKFWLFGLTIVIYFTNIFLYIGPHIARMIPTGTEYVVFTAGIAATAFLLLSFRIIVPKKSHYALAAGKL
jgi:hypothetical protein